MSAGAYSLISLRETGAGCGTFCACGRTVAKASAGVVPQPFLDKSARYVEGTISKQKRRFGSAEVPEVCALG